MKALMIFSVLTLSLLSSAWAGVGFTCHTKSHGSKEFKVSGYLKESGGKLSLKDYKGGVVFNNTRTHKKKFYRVNRKNEDNLAFAKFDIKTPDQKEKGVWLSTYYRFSLPKGALKGEQKKFAAYFGFDYADTPIQQNDLTAQQIQQAVDDVDLDEHPGTSSVEELQKMSCTKWK